MAFGGDDVNFDPDLTIYYAENVCITTSQATQFIELNLKCKGDKPAKHAYRLQPAPAGFVSL